MAFKLIYIHKSSLKNWPIKVNYPILQKKNLVISLIKTKEKENKQKYKAGL